MIVHLPSWLEGLFKVTERRAENKLIISVGGHSNTYYLFGGRDESSYTLVQGMTLAGVLFDEVALMPRSFVEQALARCSVAGSKFWFNCNPEGPMHWFYKEWVLECKRRNVLHLHFTMADNLSLSEKIKQRYEGMYTGVFYARYILGKWTKAEGLVYPFFDAKKHMIDDDGSRGRYYISCDYGTLNPCVFGLWRVNGNSAFMVKEYYYDGRKKGKQKTDEEYYDRANGYAHTSPTDAFKAKLAEAGVDLSVRFARVMPKATLLQAICRTNRTYDEGKTNGLIVDYIGIFDNVAKALNFDEGSMKKVITNIEEVKKQIPALLRKCLSYFMGVDRTVEGWEGLMAAQECLPTNKEKDKFAADYQVLNRAWNAISPDPILTSIQADYVWLSKVYESIKPTNGGGGLIWAALGPKTMEIVNSNLDVGQVHDDEEILSLDAELIDAFIEKHKNAKTAAKKVEIDLVARIHQHSDDPKFVRLGDKLERLREQHEQGLINSIEFLKMLLELAKEAAQAEKEVVPEEEIDKGKAALTELFNGVKNVNTPVIVERVVTDIDDIVKIVRFDGWQNTTAGRQEVKKALRSVVWVKYKIKDKEVFDKAYSYIEQYY